MRTNISIASRRSIYAPVAGPGSALGRSALVFRLRGGWRSASGRRDRLGNTALTLVVLEPLGNIAFPHRLRRITRALLSVVFDSTGARTNGKQDHGREPAQIHDPSPGAWARCVVGTQPHRRDA